MSLKMKDLYWLAGLFEGEGCFSTCGGGHGQARPMIAIQMYDLDVVQRVHRILRPSQRPLKQIRANRHLPFWSVKLSGHHAAGWMMTLYPLMGARRQARIKELLMRWNAAPMRRDAKYINPLSLKEAN